MHKLILANLVVVIAAVASVCDAAERSEVIESSETIFLPDALEPGLAWLRQYGTYPKSLKRFENSDSKQSFANTVHSYLDRYFQNDWVPDKVFILKNIQLVPADAFDPPNKQQDMVFLRYRVNDLNFLASYSGDANDDAARFILFVRKSLNALNDFTAKMDMFVKKDITMAGLFWVTWNNGGVAIINLVQAEYYKKTRPPFAHAPNRLFEVDAKYWKDLREAQFKVEEEREKYLADPKGFANNWLSKMSDSNPHIKLLKYEVELIAKDLEKTDLGASEKEILIRRIDATIRSLRMWCGDPPANDRATPHPGIENKKMRETQEEKERNKDGVSPQTNDEAPGQS